MGEIVFSTTAEVMTTFGKLFGRPQVLNLPVNEVGLNDWIERQKSGNPLEAAKAWAAVPSFRWCNFCAVLRDRMWLSWDAFPEHDDSPIWHVIRTTNPCQARSLSASNPASFTSTRSTSATRYPPDCAPRLRRPKS